MKKCLLKIIFRGCVFINELSCGLKFHCDFQEFQSHKKQSTGLFSRVGDSIHNMSSSYMLKYRKPEFAVMQDYMLAFGEKLGSIERITQRIVKEQGGKNSNSCVIFHSLQWILLHFQPVHNLLNII